MTKQAHKKQPRNKHENSSGQLKCRMVHTHADPLPPFRLDDFYLKPKFDFIKIALPPGIKAFSDALKFTKAIQGRVLCAKEWRDDRDSWITIHDPQYDDLQFLLDNFPEAEVLALEVAIDFFLKDGTNDPARLRAAHRHLTVNLFPQFPQPGHCPRSADGTVRKIYIDRKIIKDTLKTRSTGNAVYWTNRNLSGWEQARLYVKTMDNKLPINRHSLRLENTLSRGGCQQAGIHRVCLLPDFIKIVRRYLSPFFRVAAGIKPDIKRTRTKNPEKVAAAAHEAEKARRKTARAYEQHGAAWAAKHGNKIILDRHTSDAIGAALKGLREQLAGLKLPEKSADLLERWGPESLMYQGISECHAPLSIEAPLLPLHTTHSTANGPSDIKVV